MVRLKKDTYRNKKLTELARDESCIDCGADDGTIVWAHANLLEFGKGRSLKCSDAAGMLLCYRCHTELDQGCTMSKEERRNYQLEMIAKTLVYLLEKGNIKVSI